MRLIVIVILSCVGLGGCAAVSEAPPSAAVAVAAPPPTPSTYLDKSLRVDRLIIGGQVLDGDIAALKSAGVTRVINLRTPEEMRTLGFDEGASLAAQGLSYQQLPLGGSEFPYSPALLEAFAQEMANSKGTLALHCASGGRAGMLYAAWLVKYQGKTPEQAMRTLEPLGGWPLPMEKLLGRPLTVEFAEPKPD